MKNEKGKKYKIKLFKSRKIVKRKDKWIKSSCDFLKKTYKCLVISLFKEIINTKMFLLWQYKGLNKIWNFVK